MRISDTSGSRVTIVLAAIAGFGACAFATLVSYWVVVGGTPAVLYGRNGQFATLRRVAGLPIEFIGAVWFAAVALLYVFAWARRGRVPVFVFLSALPLAAAGFWQASTRSFHAGPITAAAVAAAIILVVSAIEEAPPLGDTLRHVFADLAAAMRRPQVVATVLGFVALTAMTAEFVILKAEGVSVRLATQQEFRTWWAAQKRLTDAQLVDQNTIRVVAFTDYQCPACSSAVPEREALVERYRSGHAGSIELVAHDFPLEPECNPGLERELHPMACETAAAVRLVGQRVGAQAAHDLGLWLYKHRDGMSSDAVKERLDEYGLRASYEQQYAALLSEIRTDAAFGRRLGVHYTPTFFVNGVQLPDTTARSFELAVEYELERRSPRAPATARQVNRGGTGIR
jgi:hypothetical protein